MGVTKAPHYANFPQHPFGQHVAVKNIWHSLPARSPETHQPLCTKIEDFFGFGKKQASAGKCLLPHPKTRHDHVDISFFFASKIPSSKRRQERMICTLRAIIWLNSRSIALHTSPYVPDPMCPCNLYLGPTATNKTGTLNQKKQRS